MGARTNKTIDADGVELLRWKSTSSELKKHKQEDAVTHHLFVFASCWTVRDRLDVCNLLFHSAFIGGPGKFPL